jgi:hypothetical protein
MGEKLFFLEHRDGSHVTKIFQTVLGVLCIGIAIYWMVFNIKSLKSDTTLWITIAFLIFFGIYQILAGTGKTKKYIETGSEKIVLKQNSVLPPVTLKPGDLEKIELFSLSIIFTMKKSGKIKLRFGVTYTDIIQPVKDEIVQFAELHNIPFEEISDEL